MATSSSKTQANMSYSVPIEDALSLLDSGFFDCDEEMLQQVNSLESDLAKSLTQSLFPCDVQGCDKKCKTKGGIKRHKAVKHPHVVFLEKQKVDEENTKLAMDRLGPCDMRKYVQEVCKNLSQDRCYPKDFRIQFENFEPTENQGQILFQTFKNLILTYKVNGIDMFLEKFRQLSLKLVEPIFADRRANQLLMLELSNKCVSHLSCRNDPTTTTTVVPLKLSEKEFAALQYVAGHVVHKIYLKLRKSKHWKEDHFQQSIQLLYSLKVEPTDDQKLIRGKDRGGLWYLCTYSVKIFEQAEVEFLRETAEHVTQVNYKALVISLMRNYFIKSWWRKLVDDSEVPVQPDVGKDILEQILGLYLRIRTFSYAKTLREKQKLKGKQSKKRSLRTELKKTNGVEP